VVRPSVACPRRRGPLRFYRCAKVGRSRPMSRRLFRSPLRVVSRPPRATVLKPAYRAKSATSSIGTARAPLRSDRPPYFTKPPFSRPLRSPHGEDLGALHLPRRAISTLHALVLDAPALAVYCSPVLSIARFGPGDLRSPRRLRLKAPASLIALSAGRPNFALAWRARWGRDSSVKGTRICGLLDRQGLRAPSHLDPPDFLTQRRKVFPRSPVVSR